MRKVSLLPVVVLLAALFMALPGGNSGSTVELRERRFAKANVRIPIGGTVWFDNRSTRTHTATCATCSRDTGDIQPGLSKPLTFPRAGVHRIVCRYHQEAGMHMQLIVGDAPPPAPVET